MTGARAARVVFLFQKAALLAKKREDGTFIVKAFIMVCFTLFHKLCIFV